MYKRFIIILFLILFLSITASHVYSAGFAILEQGAGPMGQGNAFVAQADKPSAVFFNPAGITQLKGMHACFGSTAIMPKVIYDGPHQDRERSLNKVYVLPHTYMTQEISPRIYLGLGIFSPFGLSTAWKGDWQGRYLGTYSSLKTVDINPNLAFKWGDLSASVGFNALRADLTLKRRFLTPPFLPDGAQELTGDTWGYGYNLGLLYRLNSFWQVGISYRSKIRLNFNNAEADFDMPGPLNNYFPKTKLNGVLNLPPSVTAGIAFRPSSRLSLEFDTTWTGWSTYDEVKVNLKHPVGPPGNKKSGITQPENWKDVFSYRFGLGYRITDKYTLRVGYIFDHSPAPGKNLDPMIADSNRRIYTLGLDWHITNRACLGLAYSYIDASRRRKENNISPDLPKDLRANGTYEQKTHSVGLSLRYRF